MLFLKFLKNEIIQYGLLYLTSFMWHLVFGIRSCRDILFLFIAQYCSIVNGYHSLLTHSLVLFLLSADMIILVFYFILLI